MRFWLLLALLLSELVAAPIQLTPEEKAWIKTHQTINFVGDPDWLPFEGVDDRGEYVGIVADILSLIEQKTSLHFNILHTSSWQESLKVMKEKKDAMMISQSKDSNHYSSYLFSKSYYKNPIVIVMKHENSYITSLYEIKNRRIAIKKSQPYYQKIKKKYPYIHFYNVQDVKQGLELVKNNEVDAFVHTLAQASYHINKMEAYPLRVVGHTHFYTELGFGIKPKYKPLVSIINKALDSISDKEIQAVFSRWIRHEYPQQKDITPYLIGLAILAAISIIILLYNARLRREIMKREEAECSLQELNKHLEERITQEIDARKNQEKVLEQQSRSAAMGEMMDAVAHQWKQPLNALTMYGDLLYSDFKDGTVDLDYIERMLKDINYQIEHMTTTLSEFRTFFRPNKKIQKINLYKSIQSLLLLMKDELLKNTIDVELELDKNITLNIVENEFKHVVLNIINNAKDAFIENSISHRKIKISALYTDEFIEISICDNAGGIPKDIIDTIFKPNVTTKAEGKGTGIGLYMSARIIEKSHGSIYAYNHGDGACFNIELNRNLTQLAYEKRNEN